MALTAALAGGCYAAGETAPAHRCAEAENAAAKAWDDVLPTMRSAAARAKAAAANCDAPTRDQPPCSGQMSDRFLDQSVTNARLSEVERAHAATLAKDPLAIRETARDVKDGPNVQAAKRTAEAVYAVCQGEGRAR